MAWFDKNPGGKKTETEPQSMAQPAQPEPLPAPVSAAPVLQPTAKTEAVPPPQSTAGLIGYLYKGSRVAGQLTFQGSARIDGKVDGEVSCQGTLTIGEEAEVKAKITGQVVIIQGKVEGNVTAKERIELLAPARLIGNIDAPRLIITAGVVLHGDCSMGVAKQKGEVVVARSPSADQAAVAAATKL